MRKVESIEDMMAGVARYRLADGRMVCFDAGAVQQYGVATLMRQAGVGDQIPTERLPVYQNDRRVGTMAPDFDPSNIRSMSMFYDPRPGDFRREGDRWIATWMLGPGDLEAVPGFVWAQDEKAPKQEPGAS